MTLSLGSGGRPTVSCLWCEIRSVQAWRKDKNRDDLITHWIWFSVLIRDYWVLNSACTLISGASSKAGFPGFSDAANEIASLKTVSNQPPSLPDVCCDFTLTSARTSTLLRSIPEMYLMSPHSLQAPACTYSSSSRQRTLTPPCPGPDNSTGQSAPLVIGRKHGFSQVWKSQRVSQLTYKRADDKLCVCVLHYVEDVEDVGLVLQRRTLSQLPHQRCKVGVALRVPRKVQISGAVGLHRDIRDLCIKFEQYV